MNFYFCTNNIQKLTWPLFHTDTHIFLTGENELGAALIDFQLPRALREYQGENT